MENKIITKILYVIMFIIPIATSPINIPPFTSFIRPILLLFCGIFLFVALFKKRKELVFDTTDKLLLVFWFLLSISTIFSIHKLNSIIGGFNRFEGILAFSTYFLTYYSAKYYLKFDKKIEKYFIVLSIFTCILGILQYYDFFNPILGFLNVTYRLNHADSTFGNSNFFGSFLSMIVPIYMALYLNRGNKKYLFLSALSFYAMVTCLARSSWVALFVVSIIGGIFVIKQANKQFYVRTLHIAVLFILIFIFVIYPPSFKKKPLPNSASHHFSQTFKDVKNSLEEGHVSSTAGSGRIMIWKLALKLIPHYILIGSGPDTFLYASSEHEMADVCAIYERYGLLMDKAHNEYLQYAITSGLLSLIIYLLFIGKILAKQKDIFTNKITLLFSVAIIGYLVQAFFNISTIGVAPLFWLLLGLMQNDEFKKNIQ